MINDADGNNLALLVRQSKSYPAGHNFVTSSKSELQLGIFNHPAGHKIARHWHPPYSREITTTSEVVIVESGEVVSYIYDNDHELVFESVLVAGDLVILFSGGHGFEIIKDATILEVKQGPYAGDRDKELF